MKKRIIKSISVFLALMMLMSCIAVAASAATAETVTKYGEAGGYLAIGDSISRGCGADGFYTNPETLEKDAANADGEGQYGEYKVRNVFGCVPYQIAQAVGCAAPYDITKQDATYWPFTYPGMTTAVTLDLYGIDDNYTDTDLKYSYYKDMLEYFGYEGSIKGAKDDDTVADVIASRGGIGKCGNIIDLTQNADLITVQLGMCDVFYRAYRIVSNGGMLADGMSFDLSSPEAIANLLQTAITEMYTGYNHWEKQFPLLLERIIELNPDADIVLVGAFNLVNQLTISDEIFVPIGNVISLITDNMNKKYAEWAKKYGVRYADISSTETQATELDWALLGEFKDNTFTGTHPTQKGYDYIARQILSVLDPIDDNGMNIVVDLGRFDSVDYVLLNGHRVYNFKMDGYKIIIPCSSDNAKNLTIAVYDDEHNLQVQTYSLTYKDGQGYSASRIYGNNDIGALLRKPWNAFLDFLRMILSKIVGLFK